MNKFVLASLVGLLLFSGTVYYSSNKKINELDEVIQEKSELLKEKSDLLNRIERENGVLMSKENNDVKDIKMNRMKEMLNKESIIYPIKYKKEEYYFWVDSIIKQSLDVSKDYEYKLTIKSQILKDKKDGQISYIKDEMPKKLNKLIEDENEKLKAKGVEINSTNFDLRAPNLDYIDNIKVDELSRGLTKQIEVSNSETDISFTLDSGKNSLLEQSKIVSTFVEEVIFKDKKFNNLSIDETEKIILVKVDDEVYEFDKETNELK